MILEKLKQANIDSIKNHDTTARALYSVLLNKIKLEEINKRQAGQELKDGDVAAILQKHQKNFTKKETTMLKPATVKWLLRLKNRLHLLKDIFQKCFQPMKSKTLLQDLKTSRFQTL